MVSSFKLPVLITVVVLFCVTSRSRAQDLFVADGGNSDPTNDNKVLEYNVSNPDIFPNLVQTITNGVDDPDALAVSNNQLFVANNGSGTVTEYNATTGALGFTLSSGLQTPGALAVSGNELFVADNGAGTVTEYNATTGAPGFTLSSGLEAPNALAVSGNELFVADNSAGTVTEYNATTGAAGFTISYGLSDSPYGIAVLNNELFVTVNGTSDTVNEYNLTTGAPGFTISNGLVFPQILTASGTSLYVGDVGNGEVIQYNATNGDPGFSVDGGEAGGAPTAIAVSGTNLFAEFGNGILDFNATTGAQNQSNFVGLDNVDATAMALYTVAVPEPSNWIFLLGGLCSLAAIFRIKRSAGMARCEP